MLGASLGRGKRQGLLQTTAEQELVLTDKTAACQRGCWMRKVQGTGLQGGLESELEMDLRKMVQNTFTTHFVAIRKYVVIHASLSRNSGVFNMWANGFQNKDRVFFVLFHGDICSYIENNSSELRQMISAVRKSQ